MIVSLLFRNIKCYKGINYISFFENTQNMYTIFVGENGVGKSAILEALDSLLNNKPWNINNTISWTDETRYPFICPLFLIEKDKLLLKQKEQSITEVISDYFWNTKNLRNANVDFDDALIKNIEALKTKYSKTHYLLLIGKRYQKNDVLMTSTYHKNIIKQIKSHFTGVSDSELKKQLQNIMKAVFDLHSYIYIPVEQPVSQVLKLETTEMQMLMNKNILNFIENTLDENGTVKQINSALEQFVTEVNSNLNYVDESYSYEPKSKSKHRLTTKDIREQILKTYFELRSLNVNGITLDKLSSGEQRQALINTAYAFLNSDGGDRETEVILAIDEPEISLHISKSFEQFLKLEEIIQKSPAQVLITTHWYGFIPILSRGQLRFLKRQSNSRDKGNVEVLNYGLNELTSDKRRDFPDIIELKSMFDLATSLISYMRKYPNENWIFCEGKSDEIYLNNFLREEGGFRILSLGGRDNVLKLYSIIYSTVSDKNERKNIRNKVLFITDTDMEIPNVKEPQTFGSNVENIVLLRRIVIDNNSNIQLEKYKPHSQMRKSEIENCLDPHTFIKTIKEIFKNDQRAIEMINELEQDKRIDFEKTHTNFDDPKISFIDFKSNDDLIYLNELIYHNKNDIHIKVRIAKKYCELGQENEKINYRIVEKIKELFQ